MRLAGLQAHVAGMTMKFRNFSSSTNHFHGNGHLHNK
jgi:hypothetical protein